MRRPWQVGLLFTLCAAAAVAGMAWLSCEMVRSDRQLATALAAADQQQQIAQALWRIDTYLAPLVADEIARPVGFFDPPPQAASVSQQIAAPTHIPQHVVAYFEVDLASGEWSSPHLSHLSQQLAELSRSTPLVQLSMAAPATSLAANAAAPQFAQPPSDAQYYANASPTTNPFEGELPAPQASKFAKEQTKLDDYQRRTERLQQSAQQLVVKNYSQSQSALGPTPAATPPGVTRPLWVGERLLLVRRALRSGRAVVQGAWLDWPGLERQLLDEVADLVPNATLAPVSDTRQADVGRLLASLPAVLEVPPPPPFRHVSTPTRSALAIGWTAVAVGIAAVALLLRGVVALSERRAAFVSSVTHELRTPLTTFRMYAEMLARGMVPSAERRQEYYATLQTEAERLTHLVENVLAYARLERGRPPQRRDLLEAGQLVAQLQPRLAARLAQANLQLIIELPPDVATTPLRTDAAVVEQILFNVVDNAAKYACSAADRRVILSVTRDPRSIHFTTTDHGPGFASPRGAGRLRPFSKTAEEAAESAAGVGLGLALCKRLARELGGRLTSGRPAGSGAEVTLTLPLG